MAAANRITAAGAAVTRHGVDGVEFLLVHRGYRSDWTFPKGKLDPGEHIIGAAVREVREETGYAIRLGIPLPTQTYKTDLGIKDSYYWHAQVIDGDFIPNDEVDKIEWLSFEAASKKLTYEHDQEVLIAARDAVATNPFIIMRHTQAVKRAEWSVSTDELSVIDASRPLTSVGRMQANGLVDALAAYGVSKLHSSDSRRCRDTVGPYATARSLPITLEQSMSEERHTESPKKATARVIELASHVGPLVLCTHRPVLPSVMQTLSEVFVLQDSEIKKPFDPALTPGSFVVYHRNANDLSQIVAIERHAR